MARPLLDERIRAIWTAEAKAGRPPSFQMVAEIEYDLVTAWWHLEAFEPLSRAIDPTGFKKLLRAVEASRGAGKSSLLTVLKLYLAEWVIPFLERPGLPVRAENRCLVSFGRNETHIRDDILGPLAKLVLERAPWLRTPNWQTLIEDIDNPTPEGLRALSELKSRGTQKWEALRLDLANGVSIRTRTLRQSVRGLHVFYADMDDPLTESNAHESQEIMSLIQGAILPALEPGGLFLCVGTPQQLGDLFDLIAKNPDWKYSQYPAYDVEGRLGYAAKNRASLGEQVFASLPEADHHSLWPARLSYTALEQSQGTTRESSVKYQREFLLLRVTDDTALVNPDDIIACRDTDLSYHHSPTPGVHYRGGVDPSKLKKDEAGFCVGYVLKDGTKIPALFSTLLVNPHLPLGKPEMMVVDEINMLSKQFGCYDWMVESNGFQSALVPLMGFVNQSIRFKDFHLTSNKHTENGWAGLRTLFRSRKIRLPYKTEEDRAMTALLVHQLMGLQYVGGKVVEDPNRANDRVSALFLWLKNVEDVPAELQVTAIAAPGAYSRADGLTLPGGVQRGASNQGGELAGHNRAMNPQRDNSLAGIMKRLDRWQAPRRR